jgi:hypothetical protein
MSDNSTQMNAETHNIDANDSLVRSVIVDQADNLEKGWREAIQNGIDSGATKVSLDYDTDFSFVEDNGSGVELTQQQGLDLLTTMGESSKDADDHASIGEFGIGKGQIIAKGKTMFASGTTALLFDITNWGLEARTVPLSDAADIVAEQDPEWAHLILEKFGTAGFYDGMGILVKHYPDEVPSDTSWRWDDYEGNLKDRFRFLESVRDTEVCLNGVCISNGDPRDVTANGEPTHSTTYQSEMTGDVHIGVRHGNGDLTVHSGGIMVKDVQSRGLQGTIVTERNLRLNFARNEIKSGCPIWTQLNEVLVDIRAEVFDHAGHLNDDAREFYADRMLNKGETQQHGDKEVFETASESYVSYNHVMEQAEIGYANKGNKAADRLEEAFGLVVLNEDDGAVAKFAKDDNPDKPGTFDAQDRASDEGIHTQFEQVDEYDLKPMQRKKLGVARFIAHQHEEVPDYYEVTFGESDVAHAWTNGVDSITITDSATESNQWVQWVPELWQTMQHEIAHRFSSKEEPSHGRSYANRYWKTVEKQGGIDNLSHLMGEISSHTLDELLSTVTIICDKT